MSDTALFQAALRVAFADDDLEAHEQEALGGLVQVLGLDPADTAAVAAAVRAEQASGMVQAPAPEEAAQIARELRSQVRRSSAPEAAKQGALDGLTRLFGPEPAAEVPAIEEAGIAPLQCSACGAPVPLADRAQVPCESCGAEVAVPEQYRALRRARGRLSLAQGEAGDFLAVLGHAPGRIERTLAYLHLPLVALPVPLAFWILATELALVPAVYLGAWYGAGACGVCTFSLRTKTLLRVFTAFALLVFPWVLSRFWRVKEVTRLDLLDGLAARPPSHPGGPAGCRKCGAPLEVEAGALGVVCDYCGVENVIRRDAEDFHEEHGAALFAADNLAAARLNYRDRTGTAWVKALGLAGVTAIVLAFVVLIVPEMAWNTFPGKWHEEVEHGNRHAMAVWSGWDQWGDLGTSRGHGMYTPEERAPGSPAARATWVDYFLPVRAGEVVRVHFAGRRVRKRKVLAEPATGELSVRGAPQHAGESDQVLLARPGAPAELVAPVSGWYRLQLRQGDLEPGLDVWVTVRAP